MAAIVSKVDRQASLKKEGMEASTAAAGHREFSPSGTKFLSTSNSAVDCNFRWKAYQKGQILRRGRLLGRNSINRRNVKNEQTIRLRVSEKIEKMRETP